MLVAVSSFTITAIASFIALFTSSSVLFQFRYLMNIVRRLFPRVFWYKPTDQPVIALTIDDAPSKDTEALLDILERYNIKATFFIIANEAKS